MLPLLVTTSIAVPVSMVALPMVAVLCRTAIVRIVSIAFVITKSAVKGMIEEKNTALGTVGGSRMGS